MLCDIFVKVKDIQCAYKLWYHHCKLPSKERAQPMHVQRVLSNKCSGTYIMTMCAFHRKRIELYELNSHEKKTTEIDYYEHRLGCCVKAIILRIDSPFTIFGFQ